MQVKVCISISANIHSHKKVEIDTEDLGYTEAEWKKLSDDQKWEAARDYWSGMGDPEIWVEEPST